MGFLSTILPACISKKIRCIEKSEDEHSLFVYHVYDTYWMNEDEWMNHPNKFPEFFNVFQNIFQKHNIPKIKLDMFFHVF